MNTIRPPFTSRAARSTARVAAFLLGVWTALTARAQTDHALFGEALENGWQNWSWATVSVGDATVAHAGTKSIKVTIAGAWEALYLAHGALDTTPFTALSFWIHGGTSGGQRLNVQALLGGKATGAVVPLDPLPANVWKNVVIPLASLGVANAPNLDGIWLADAIGAVQAAFFVDEIRLLHADPPGEGTTRAPVSVVVDVARNRHPIDPRIYGTSFASAAELAELNAPLNRWGGNNTTRYNWKLNALNTDFDYFFQSHPASASAAPGAAVDDLVARSLAHDSQPMLTLPTLGWVAKLGPNRGILWSYSVAKYGPQSETDVWRPDSGNGRRASDGSLILTNDPLDASVPVDLDYQAEWVRHLTNRWGSAKQGGVRYYVLDNEPSLWHGTHYDVQRRGATMEDVRDRSLALAEKVKAIDPDALVVGPEEWGWLGLLYSGADQQYAAEHENWSRFPDREAHGNMDFMPWYLDQARRRSETVGRRLLDVVTTHFYPAGVASGDVSESAQLLRNRSTRALWDPSYRDESWINAPIGLIPRLKAWVRTYYPGTQIGITEYNWGWAEQHMNAATAQADLLGIFGREGLDLATRWTTPTNTSPTFQAMRLYRNYDGRKSTFGDISLLASVPNPDHVAAFAAERSSDGALSVIVINKQLRTVADLSLSVSNFASRGDAELWRLQDATGIQRLASVPTDRGVLAASLPPRSVSLFVLPAAVARRPGLRIEGRSTHGDVRIVLTGEPGRTYAIEASADFVAWQEVARVPLGAPESAVSIPGQTQDHRFFRVALVP